MNVCDQRARGENYSRDNVAKNISARTQLGGKRFTKLGRADDEKEKRSGRALKSTFLKERRFVRAHFLCFSQVMMYHDQMLESYLLVFIIVRENE